MIVCHHWPVSASSLQRVIIVITGSGGLLLLTVGARMRRVTVVVCLVLEHLFLLKMLSHTQRATEVKQFVKASLKPLRCRDPTLRTVGHFPAESAHAHYALIVLSGAKGSAL